MSGSKVLDGADEAKEDAVPEHLTQQVSLCRGSHSITGEHRIDVA